jgi:ADP-ribose pyrophosphatase YjhB (NUDIX family)
MSPWVTATGGDIIRAGDGWITAAEYELITARVPIVCTDILLICNGRAGLIYRETYDAGFGWCLIGGRVLRNETLTDAVARHIEATVGPTIRFDQLKLVTVAEYPNLPVTPGGLYDPRKHDIGITYTACAEGTAEPRGEALGFHWFSDAELAGLTFGFGHGTLVRQLLGER